MERALPEVWMDLSDPDFARAMAEFREILRLTGREALDVDWAESEFFAAEILQVGGRGERKEIAVVSPEELTAFSALPCRDGAFRQVRSEELVHCCEPEELLRVLKELRRVLSEQGRVRFSTIDFDFVTRLALGQEPEYESWYGETFLKEDNEVCSLVSVVNHLTRSWGHRFFYNRESLRALLVRAGFDELREVVTTDAEVNADGKGFTAELYRKERFILEGKVAAIAPATESRDPSKIGVVTMILVRMELKHLEEWLQHLAQRGIERVWIYWEESPADSFFEVSETGGWGKKPKAGNCEGMSDEEVMEEFSRIREESPVEVTAAKSRAKGDSVGFRQSCCGNDALIQLKKEDYDWAIFLDVDEFLVGDLTVLEEIGEEVAEVRLQQKVFVDRWGENQEALAVRGIRENYGLADFSLKYFFRPRLLRKFGSVHDSSKHLEGLSFCIEPGLVRFHHFRGLPDEGESHPRLHSLARYTQLHERGLQREDDSHNWEPQPQPQRQSQEVSDVDSKMGDHGAVLTSGDRVGGVGDVAGERLKNLRTLLFTNGDANYLRLQENLMRSMERVGFPMETLSVEVVGSTGGVYGTSEFNETVLKKLDLVCSLLRDGHPVLFVDVDIVFLKNPLHELLRQLEAGVDAVFQSAGQNPVSKVNTGFFLVLPTEASVSLFDVSNWKPEERELQRIHDQQYINQKLNSLARGSFRYETLALTQFPTGNYWFSGRADDEPTIVHYNYIKGVNPKIKRMRSFGHWFLDEI